MKSGGNEESGFVEKIYGTELSQEQEWMLQDNKADIAFRGKGCRVEREMAAEGTRGITIMNCISNSGGRRGDWRGGWMSRCHWMTLSDVWWERKQEKIGRSKGESFTGGTVWEVKGVTLK